MTLRFILVDGPAGAGKTTYAATLGPVIHLDDLYDGWTGLQAGIDQAQALVDALRAGEPAGYHRYDWQQGAYTEWVPVAADEVLVIEGCGAGSVRVEPSLLVWVEAADSLERAIERDGDSSRDALTAWAALAASIAERDQVRQRASTVLSS